MKLGYGFLSDSMHVAKIEVYYLSMDSFFRAEVFHPTSMTVLELNWEDVLRKLYTHTNSDIQRRKHTHIHTNSFPKLRAALKNYSIPKTLKTIYCPCQSSLKLCSLSRAVIFLLVPELKI